MMKMFGRMMMTMFFGVMIMMVLVKTRMIIMMVVKMAMILLIKPETMTNRPTSPGV